MTTILFKKTRIGAVAPTRAHDGDAGWDVTVPMNGVELKPDMAIYSLGLAFAVPKGMWLMAVPRSSVYKTGMVLANGVGVIDAGYRGEIKAMFWRVKRDWSPYMDGDRACQLILMPERTDDVEFVEVDDLPDSWDGRNADGFGSTGGHDGKQ